MKIIGHRGAKGLALENTIASIQKAIDCGVDEVEIDARITSDGIIVLNHDATLKNKTERPLEIKSRTFAELKILYPHLTTLEDAIIMVNRRVPLMIEIKKGVPTDSIINLIKDFLSKGWATSDFSFTSFSQNILRELHRALPEIPIVIDELWSGVRARMRARELHTKRINMLTWWVWRGYLIAMARQGYQITPYSLNNLRRAKRWEKYLYGVITDRPDLFTRK